MKLFREQEIQWTRLLEDDGFRECVWEWAQTEMRNAATRAAAAKELVEIGRHQGEYLAFERFLGRPVFVGRQAEAEERQRKQHIGKLKRGLDE